MWRYIIFTIIFTYLHFLHIYHHILLWSSSCSSCPSEDPEIFFHKFLNNLLVIIIFKLLRGYCAIKHASLSWYSASQFEVDLLPGVTPMNLELKCPDLTAAVPLPPRLLEDHSGQNHQHFHILFYLQYIYFKAG